MRPTTALTQERTIRYMKMRENNDTPHTPSTTDRFTKWVSCWGNATSITDRREATYARDLTLRYPIRIPFDGCKLRFRFSNLRNGAHHHHPRQCGTPRRLP